SYSTAIRFVVRSERLAQSWLLMRDHEQVRGEKKNRGVNQDRQRSVENRRAYQGEDRTDIHWVSHESIRSADDQPARRIKRRRRTFAGKYKSEHAPKRDGRASDRNYHSDNLLQADHRWPRRRRS